MAKVYTEEELNNFSRETLMAVILSMQDQIHQLNTNMERLIEQIADANNKHYGRSSKKLETISGQLELELIFNEAEALTETLYVVEPVEEDVIQPRRKNKGKREADLKDLPIEVIVHTLSEEKLQDVFGRVAKPEGTKVRKFDHVSRLPLFPYHHNIWKRYLNRRDSDTFYTI